MNKLDQIYHKIDKTSLGEYEKDINPKDLNLIGTIEDKELSLSIKLYHYQKENLTILDQYDGRYNITVAWTGLHEPTEFIYYTTTKNLEYHA